ncbi:prosaposin-like isoform X1 [Pomacea canaliculata]|nr:prosaposin-like isoform X1 [Pomacea canaliculata]
MVDTWLQNRTTPSAANATVAKLCDLLSEPTRDLCTTFAPLIVDAIMKGVDPVGACTNIGLCLSEKDKSKAIPKKKAVVEIQAGPACELCELLVQTIDTYLKDNKTEAAVNATVYKVCNSLPEPIKSTCLGFAPELVSVVSQGMDPQKACTYLKLCTSAGGIDNTLTLRSLQDGPECQLCELLINIIDIYIKDNKSEAVINATIYKVCDSLSGTYKILCLGLAPQLITVIAKGLDPLQACTSIKICSEEPAAVDVTLPSDPQDGPLCEMCELLVQTIDTYLKDNKTEAAINATVYKVCNSLPDAIKSMCLSLAPQLITAISQGLDPKQACTYLKVCTSVTTINYQLLLKEIEAGPLCDLCELVIQTVDTYLKDNKTEAAINATVYKVCNSLPDPIKSTCLGFAPEVVAALAQGLDPQQACTYLKLCTSGRELLLKAPYIRRSEAGLQDVKCDVCKNALGIVDNDLYQDEGKIQTMLEDICHRLPPPTDQACLNAVDEYFPQIWENILSKGASPESICKLLGLCSS